MEKGIRRLCWFTLGFGAALACIVLLCWNQAGILTAAGWALAIPVLTLSRRHPGFRRLGILLLGFGAGATMLLCQQKSTYGPLLPLDETVREVELHCQKDSTPGLYGHSVEGTWDFEGKTYGIRAYLPEGRSAQAGDKVSGTFRLNLTLPGGSKVSGGNSGRGVFLTASPKGDIRVIPGEKSLGVLPQILGRSARTAISRCFPEDVAPFAQSLLLGDTQDLSYTDETALRVSGIRHIVAVSGLHVAMLFGIIWLLSGKTPWIAFVAGLPVLWIFAAAAGFTSSVCRACIMSALLVLAKLSRRAYDPKTALAAAALWLMADNPLVIAAPGFQLSVLSVLGILLFQKPLSSYFQQHLPPKRVQAFPGGGGFSLCQPQCHGFIYAGFRLVFWGDLSGGCPDQSADVVDFACDFRGDPGCLLVRPNIPGTGCFFGQHRGLAHSTGAVYFSNAFLPAYGGGVYLQQMERLLAAFCLRGGGSVVSVPEKAGEDFLCHGTGGPGHFRCPDRLRTQDR